MSVKSYNVDFRPMVEYPAELRLREKGYIILPAGFIMRHREVDYAFPKLGDWLVGDGFEGYEGVNPDDCPDASAYHVDDYTGWHCTAFGPDTPEKQLAIRRIYVSSTYDTGSYSDEEEEEEEL